MTGTETVERLVASLSQRGETLALAESCTGGLASSLVTDVAGASEVFDRGLVTYTVPSKAEVLGVEARLLEEAGPVSEPVAEAMARGARRRASVDWASAVTGIAGPTGGTEATPVGTVFVAVAGPGETTVERYTFEGDRAEVKRSAAEQALADVLARLPSQSPS